MPPPALGRDRPALAVVAALVSLKAVVHLVLVRRYGYHGDELYFIECGRRLALGYVDHPPLIPWMARLADELGGGLLALRLPAIAMGAGTLALVALLVRDWGGGRAAQALALLCLLVAPAHLRLGAMLNIPVVEVFLCTAVAYLVSRALARGERWSWVLAGGALGLAMLAKHSSALWGVALALGILSSPGRRALTTRWPWIGAAVAFLVALPNLLWQFDNHFISLEFMRALRHDVLAEQGRGLFVAGQLLYFHPLAVPVWVAGLLSGLTGSGKAARPFAVLFLALFTFFLVAGGKPYYLASAYPPVIAAGAVALERILANRPQMRRTLIGSLAATGLALAVLTLPALPIHTVDRAIGAVLGWVVPPIALTHDMHGMLGWEAHTATVDRVYGSLPADERRRASVLTGSYSQAAALNVLRPDPVPRAVSGHLTYYLWGPDDDRGEVLIAYGLPRELLERHYRACSESGRIDAPLARPQDTDLPVYVCRGPLRTMAELWPDLRRIGHSPPTSGPAPAGRPGVVDETAFRRLMETLAAGWTEGDSRKAADCFTEDAVYVEPPDKQVYRGRQELYEFFGGGAGRNEPMRMTWHHLVFDEQSQIGAGEFTFEYGGAVHGMVIVRLRDGRIANWREYWYESPLAWEEFTRQNPF